MNLNVSSDVSRNEVDNSFDTYETPSDDGSFVKLMSQVFHKEMTYVGAEDICEQRNEMGYGAQADRHEESSIASGLSELSKIAWNRQVNQENHRLPHI